MKRMILALFVLATSTLCLASTPTPHDTLREIRGVIAGVNADEGAFLLHTRHGFNVRVVVSDHTRIGVNGSMGSLRDLEPGMRAIVRGRPDVMHHRFLARTVRARTPHDGPGDGSGDGNH